MGVMTFQGESLPWELSPLEALRRWPSDRRVLMLHSGRPDARWSRYTVLTTATGAYRFDASGQGSGHSSWLGEPGDCPVTAGGWTQHPLRDLERVLADHEAMWVGYLGYDLGRFIEKLASPAADDRGWPIVQMHRCPGWLVHDNQTGQWNKCGTWRTG